MRRVLLAVTLPLVAACGAHSGSTTAPNTSVAASDNSTAAASAAARAPSAPHSWRMPDLRGKDLQTAQDAIQSLTNDEVFFTYSHDLTGRGRHQILDRDWKVCTETPRAGARFTTDTRIDFGVVRINSESCP